MSELELLRKLAEHLRYYTRHGIVDASKDINEELYNLLYEYEEIRKTEKIEEIEFDFENEGC